MLDLIDKHGAQAMQATRTEQASQERLYQAYRRDRDDGMSHAQIVADGVYSTDAEAFCLRYDLAVAGYADAMVRSALLRGPAPNDPGTSIFGQPLPRSAA
jgi:hypothetical protein